jgi:hypothetical protein
MKKKYIKLVFRDLRTPERNEPLLKRGSGDARTTHIRSDIFVNMWPNKANRETYFIADGKDLNDLLNEGLLDDIQFNMINNEMLSIELANLSPEQRKMREIEERLRKEMELKYEQKPKTKRTRTTKEK